ncbi:hypothetical protein RB213_012504 [Colletotrichum asianum]
MTLDDSSKSVPGSGGRHWSAGTLQPCRPLPTTTHFPSCHPTRTQRLPHRTASQPEDTDLGCAGRGAIAFFCSIAESIPPWRQ